MGLLEILTIIFVVLKLAGVISWSWWLVLLPEIVAIGLYIVWVTVFGVFAGKMNKEFMKEWSRF